MREWGREERKKEREKKKCTHWKSVGDIMELKNPDFHWWDLQSYSMSVGPQQRLFVLTEFILDRS